MKSRLPSCYAQQLYHQTVFPQHNLHLLDSSSDSSIELLFTSQVQPGQAETIILCGRRDEDRSSPIPEARLGLLVDIQGHERRIAPLPDIEQVDLGVCRAGSDKDAPRGPAACASWPLLNFGDWPPAEAAEHRARRPKVPQLVLEPGLPAIDGTRAHQPRSM